MNYHRNDKYLEIFFFCRKCNSLFGKFHVLESSYRMKNLTSEKPNHMKEFSDAVIKRILRGINYMNEIELL